MIAPRKPWLAAVLSLGLPGLGHLYAGRPRAAGAAFLLSVFAAAVALGAPVFLPIPALGILLAVLGLLVLLAGIPWHAAKAAAATSETYELRPYNRWFIYLGLYVVVDLFLGRSALDHAKTHLVEAFRVPSGSMEPTVRMGDYLYVAKWDAARTDLRPGTVVVFESVEEPGLKVIKRIAGLPGDTLKMQAGTLYRNGQPLAEPYSIRIDPGRSEDAVQREKMRAWQMNYFVGTPPDPYRPDLEDWGPVAVPLDSLFVLGDNRDASYDSRYWGFVPRGNVLGQPWVVYFSYDPKGVATFPSRVRWARIGQVLH
jgi:signal peptidase I